MRVNLGLARLTKSVPVFWLAGVLACSPPPPTTTPPPAAPSPATTASLSGEVRLAIATAGRELQDLRGGDPGQAKQSAQRARQMLHRFYSDPTNDDAEAWRLLGVIAWVQRDVQLAALAMNEVERLRPNYLDDAQLRDLMVELNRLTTPEARKTQKEKRSLVLGLQAARGGDTMAMSLLGVCFQNGLGVPKDAAEAVKWYRKAADAGDTRAMHDLGVCYANGEGVTADEAEAVAWYLKAAEGGHGPAMNRLGVCYERGLGVATDAARAVMWYRRAVERRYPVAMYNLGLCYANGTGVTKDEAEAVRWFRNAAQVGVLEARLELRRRGLSM